MEQSMKNTDVCRKCGGPLLEEEDYIAGQMFRRALAAIPVAALLCAAWAPLFALVRTAVGGGFGNVSGSVAAFVLALILKKILVGAVIGALIGVGVGIWRSGWGLFVGTVVGSLGGFFIAATAALPLRSEAAHRLDVVLVAVLAGLLGAVTAVLADGISAKRSAKYIGPEIIEGKQGEK